MKCTVCNCDLNGSYALAAMTGKLGCLDCHALPEPEATITLKPEEVWVPKASKNDNGKPDLSLIPYSALQAESLAMMVGAAKYGRYNYTKGHEASQLVAAAMRHLLAWFDGEENDPQDGQPHLGSVRACIGMLLEQQRLGTLKDNRRKDGK